MNFRKTRRADRNDDAWDVGEAYVLLEAARLRCEDLLMQAASARKHGSLREIQRELGMAGWLASAEIDSEQRLRLLADAQDRSRQSVLDTVDAMASAAILAEDALVRSLEREDLLDDQLHLAHMHLLRAHELLHDMT